jgi:SHS2 domain-containing protein
VKYIKKLKKFREIEHTADTGLEVSGDTLAQLFANAAFGFYHLLFGHITIRPSHMREIVLEEQMVHDLMVRWLSELNYLLQVDQFVTGEIHSLSVEKINASYNLSAKLAGNQDRKYINKARFEIKAVTYHQLEIEQNKSGYQTRIFFDI